AVLLAQLPGGGAAILNTDSFWRYYVTIRPPVVAGEPNAVIAVTVPYRSYPGIERIETSPPPEDWAGADFDDGGWNRGRAKGLAGIPGVIGRPGIEFSIAAVSMRGKFEVADPSAVKSLELAMRYRGGVVIRVNGQEVARGDMPGGEPKPTTAARPYPDEAWVNEAGKLLSAKDVSAAGRLAKRDRQGTFAIPPAALRRGVNVLAIDIRRADYHPAAARGNFMENGWAPIGLLDVRLSATGGRVAANVTRPAGVQVWNADVNDRIDVTDYGDPAESKKPGPIRIVAARNGSFAGQVVVGSGSDLRDVKAVAGELTSGAGKIPAARLQVRYGLVDQQAHGRADWADGLSEQPPAEVKPSKGGGAVVPIWLTVNVPAEAAAGLYRGEMKVSAAGLAETIVPVEVTVANWAIPDPKQFRTYVGIYQSPTTVALQYKVDEWSEQHWKLLEKSFAMLSLVGNRIVNIPLVDRTQFGNDEGMVYWIAKPDGTYDYDFSVFDRYVQMTKKYFGAVDFVALHVWHASGWEVRRADQENTVTVIDKATGRREHKQVPAFGTEESKKFWKPVLDAIRERLAKEGLDKAMCLGILSDGTAPPEVFKAFDAIIPGGSKWTRGCHTVTNVPGPYRLLKDTTAEVVCHEYCYGMSMADPAKGLPAIHAQRGRPGIAYIRHNWDHTTSLLKYRTFAERALYCGTRGVGRTCLDFWPVIADKRGDKANIYNRWPFSSCGQRSPNTFYLSRPGPAGAEPTVRFEQFREGIQQAEAMIVVSEAMTDRAAEIGPERVARCRQLFIDRLNFAKAHAPESYGQISMSTDHCGWRELNRRLFDLAGEVAAKK
ncbi:MAG: DUF6067 family protein, partial [Phycisphaerae bacterium]|nr:DUF6067 family protein [Phycisphaerae bacterium]